MTIQQLKTAKSFGHKIHVKPTKGTYSIDGEPYKLILGGFTVEECLNLNS